VQKKKIASSARMMGGGEKLLAGVIGEARIKGEELEVQIKENSLTNTPGHNTIKIVNKRRRRKGGYST